MVKKPITPWRRCLLIQWILVCLLCFPVYVLAHPMPNSVVLMDIKEKGVAMELQLPLTELQLSFGHEVAANPHNLIDRLGPQLQQYIAAHVRAVGPQGQQWPVAVQKMALGNVEQSASGPYRELTAHLWLQAPEGSSTRTFRLYYDVIIHQVATHAALVSIRQDWEAGIMPEAPVQAGVVSLDIVNNIVRPIDIRLGAGSQWAGFTSMVLLGIRHIGEGTDHLLFLLMLLLPAPLLYQRPRYAIQPHGRSFFAGRWGNYGGMRYSLFRLLRIVTAFTIGHSVTLLFGALGWLVLPAKSVELCIAFSILVSAVHAWRPLFPGKETIIASGFGLVHGLAFAGTLSGLNLDAGPMALSILGFNAGIEIMQLFVVAITVPWLMILSTTKAYVYIRTAGAALAGMAALGWMLQRYSEQSNALSVLLQSAPEWGLRIVAGLAVLALFSLLSAPRKSGI